MGRAYEYRRASKEKRWDKMSRIFPRLAKNITIAASEGGSDPFLNSKLRTAIQNAKAENMPKDNIDAAIKRATSKDTENYQEITYEGKGPHGSLVFVECATDNNTRTVANIKVYFNKSGGTIVPTGSLEFMFIRKAFFDIAFNPSINIEELELELIDSGLEQIEQVEDMIYILGDYKDFNTLSIALEERKIPVIKSGLKRVPTNPQEFTEDQIVDIEKLIDKLEEDADVQSVYTNIA